MPDSHPPHRLPVDPNRTVLEFPAAVSEPPAEHRGQVLKFDLERRPGTEQGASEADHARQMDAGAGPGEMEGAATAATQGHDSSAERTSTPPPSMPAPHHLTSEQARRWNRITQWHAAVARYNHFQTMRLSPTCTDQEVSAQFQKLYRRWDPSRLGSELEPLAPHVERIRRRVQLAHEALKDPVCRAQHLGELAQRCLQQGRHSDGLKLVCRALELDSRNPRLRAECGWLLYQQGGRDAGALQQAEHLIREALTLDDACERAHHFQGLLAMERHDLTLASRHFARAVALDPHNTEAARLFRMCRNKSSGVHAIGNAVRRLSLRVRGGHSHGK